jgi:D-alanyl-D-alanine dipeptidase
MLVEIQPGAEVHLDLVYATPANLTGAAIYARAACFLHPDAVGPFRRAAALAAGLDLRLHVFDAFRPSEAQWALWRFLPDPMYIADPRQGSNHSRGVAIDLTLAGRDGRPLDMGTPFDDMTTASHHGSDAVAGPARTYRLLLLGLMAAAGFVHYPYEWWHYELPDAARYPVLDDATAGTGLMAP